MQQLLSGTPADSDSLQDLRYTYDLSGNLLSLQDYLAGAPQTQSFAYDALDRLVSAAASGGDNGLGDYSLEMAYDPGSGNLRQKGELLYLYGDSGHTHAVTAVSDGWRYEYDPNCNLVRKVSQPWLLLDLYLPVVMSSLPEETLDSPPESPESQSAPVSPYPPPEEQSRGQTSGLVAWLHSAWDFLVRLFARGQHTAQAAGLQQAYPPPGDPTPGVSTPTPPSTSTPVPTPTSTPTPTATPVPLEEILYTYDAENRLVSVSSGEVQASFVYDGDGQRVASFINGSVTVYIGEVFEWDVASSSMRRYYYAGVQRVAMRLENASPVWLLGDHLGSTSVAADADGSLLSRQGYLPWGELRFAEGSLPGRYQFTGQASYEAEFGLYYYKARWYDPHLGRFSQADSMVPVASQGVQAFDRYAYVNNNPIRYKDPSGQFTEDEIQQIFGVDSWDDVLLIFQEEGALEGHWGWLTVLQKAKLGDKISINWDANQLPNDHPDVEASYNGTFELDKSGRLIISGENSYIDQMKAAKYGSSYSLMHYTSDNAKKAAAAFLILATDITVGIPAFGLMLSGQPALMKAGEILETFVVLPVNILGVKMWRDAEQGKLEEVLSVSAIPNQNAPYTPYPKQEPN